MLLSTFDGNIDKTGQIVIPSDHRAFLQEGVVLTRGFDQCITIYSLSQWQIFSNRYSSLPETHEKHRKLIRFIFSGASKAKLDKNGKILIPPSLQEYAQIIDKVLIVGNNTHLEIWSDKLWEVELKSIVEHAWELAERIDLN